VEQPLTLLTPIRCSRLHFDVGMPGEEPAPEVAGKAYAELRNALSAAQDLGSNERIWEFWKSEVGEKNPWRVLAIKRSLNSSISQFLYLSIPELYLLLFLIWSRLGGSRYLGFCGEGSLRASKP
jgi:hypothetical protein